MAQPVDSCCNPADMRVAAGCAVHFDSIRNAGFAHCSDRTASMTPTTLDIPRTMLAVLFIGLLIAASLWILSPFLTALIWATTIVVTTWPVMISVQKHLWGKRGLAVTVMTVALLLAFFVPFGFA